MVGVGFFSQDDTVSGSERGQRDPIKQIHTVSSLTVYMVI